MARLTFNAVKEQFAVFQLNSFDRAKVGYQWFDHFGKTQTASTLQACQEWLNRFEENLKALTLSEETPDFVKVKLETVFNQLMESFQPVAREEDRITTATDCLSELTQMAEYHGFKVDFYDDENELKQPYLLTYCYPSSYGLSSFKDIEYAIGYYLSVGYGVNHSEETSDVENPIAVGSTVQMDGKLLYKAEEDGCCSQWKDLKGNVYLLSDRKVLNWHQFSHLKRAENLSGSNTPEQLKQQAIDRLTCEAQEKYGDRDMSELQRLERELEPKEGLSRYTTATQLYELQLVKAEIQRRDDDYVKAGDIVNPQQSVREQLLAGFQQHFKEWRFKKNNAELMAEVEARIANGENQYNVLNDVKRRHREGSLLIIS